MKLRTEEAEEAMQQLEEVQLLLMMMIINIHDHHVDTSDDGHLYFTITIYKSSTWSHNQLEEVHFLLMITMIIISIVI